jgi:hypothetical protein
VRLPDSAIVPIERRTTSSPAVPCTSRSGMQKRPWPWRKTAPRGLGLIVMVRAVRMSDAPAALAIRICINRSLNALQHVDRAPAITRQAVSLVRSLLSRVALDQARHALASWILVWVARFHPALQSQLSAPPVWYSMTRVSKKFFSFLRSIISDIQGKGLDAPENSRSSPIC